MRFLSYLTTLLIAALLAACGGGGGSPGTTSGSALFTSAPSSVIIPVGASQPYVIRGGSGPYLTRTSDAAIAVGIVDGNTFILGGVAPGTATVALVDNSGAQISVSVTVGSSTAFYTTAPATFTISPKTSQTFKLGGGVAPYTVTSSNVSIASATVSGSNLTITSLLIGSATVQIRDAAGATLSASVTVGTVPLALNPTSAQAFIGDVVVSRITGGTPPYRVSVGIPDAVTATIESGNQLTMTFLRLASPVIVTVLDANDQPIVFTATIILGTNKFRLSPDALAISEKETQPVLLTVIGAATTGTTRVFSSNTDLLTVSLSGSVVTVSPTAKCVSASTPVTITAVDSKGAIGTAIVTVTDNGNTAAVVGPPAVAASNCPP